MYINIYKKITISVPQSILFNFQWFFCNDLNIFLAAEYLMATWTELSMLKTLKSIYKFTVRCVWVMSLSDNTYRYNMWHSSEEEPVYDLAKGQ